MSYRVLVIPEDPTYNGYILQPLIERMMAEIGKPHARVHVLNNPKLNGYTVAVKAIRKELVERYRFFDLWLFVPDADRAKNLEPLEKKLQAQGITLLCCAAEPELEAWLLAGYRDKLNCSWEDIRSHPRLKEDIFTPFLKHYGNSQAVGEGRKKLMQDALADYNGILSACSELRRLQERLREKISGQ